MKLILALALGATAQFATPALRGGARRLEALELLGAEESAKVEAEQEAQRAKALEEAMAQLKEAQDMMAKAEALKAEVAEIKASMPEWEETEHAAAAELDHLLALGEHLLAEHLHLDEPFGQLLCSRARRCPENWAMLWPKMFGLMCELETRLEV